MNSLPRTIASVSHSSAADGGEMAFFTPSRASTAGAAAVTRRRTRYVASVSALKRSQRSRKAPPVELTRSPAGERRNIGTVPGALATSRCTRSTATSSTRR